MKLQSGVFIISDESEFVVIQIEVRYHCEKNETEEVIKMKILFFSEIISLQKNRFRTRGSPKTPFDSYIQVLKLLMYI